MMKSSLRFLLLEFEVVLGQGQQSSYLSISKSTSRDFDENIMSEKDCFDDASWVIACMSLKAE